MGIAKYLALFTTCMAWFMLVPDYGATWDEPLRLHYGRAVLAYYSSGFEDRTAIEFFNHRHYGGIVEAPLAWIADHSSFDPYLVRHSLLAAIALFGIAAVIAIGRLLGGSNCGYVAGGFCAGVPAYFGHSFNNSKDLPFAVAYTWAVLFVLRCAKEFPRVRMLTLLGLAMAIGVAMGIRMGGAVLLVVLGAALLFRIWELVHEREVDLLAAAIRGASYWFAVLCLSWAIMLPAWPFGMESPIANPITTLFSSGAFEWPHTVLFRGEHVQATDLPWFYLPFMLGAKLPEYLVVLSTIGSVFLLGRVLQRGKVQGLPRSVFAAFFFATFAPLTYAVVANVTSYDGIRHVLFAVPSLAVVSAFGLTMLLKRLHTRPVFGSLVGLAVAISFIAVLRTMVGLHPNQYVYYNRFVGGLSGAAGQFETDYWGNSYAEALRLLAARLERKRSPTRVPIYTCKGAVLADYYTAPYFERVKSPQEARYFIANTRWGCDRSIRASTIINVSREGVPLTLVKRLRW